MESKSGSVLTKSNSKADRQLSSYLVLSFLNKPDPVITNSIVSFYVSFATRLGFRCINPRALSAMHCKLCAFVRLISNRIAVRLRINTGVALHVPNSIVP